MKLLGVPVYIEKCMKACQYYFISFIYHIQLQFTVEISYFEIYNEKIHDLLATSKKKDNKKVQVNFYLITVMADLGTGRSFSSKKYIKLFSNHLQTPYKLAL